MDFKTLLSSRDFLFLDGATGTVHDKVNLGGLIEASPVAYENMLVVGTKAKKICGMKVS